MEISYCLSCGKEIPTEGGQLCEECGYRYSDNMPEAWERYRSRPSDGLVKALLVFVFAVGLSAGLVLGAWRAACVQRAWDEDSLAWEKARAAAYDSGYEAGRRLAWVQAAVVEEVRP